MLRTFQQRELVVGVILGLLLLFLVSLISSPHKGDVVSSKYGGTPRIGMGSYPMSMVGMGSYPLARVGRTMGI